MEIASVRNVNQRLWTKNFIFLSLSNTFLFMAFEMLMPIIPLYVESLGGNASQIGLVISALMMTAILIRLFSKTLSVKFGKSNLLIIGVAISMLATSFYSLATGIIFILLIRLAHGVGIATTFYATIAYEHIPAHKRGEGMGYFGIGGTLAFAIGPLFGIWLIQYMELSSIFLVGGFILLLSLIMTIFTGKAPSEEVKRSPVEPVKVSFSLFERRVLLQCILILLCGISVGATMTFVVLYAYEKGFTSAAWFFFIMAVSELFIRIVSGKLFDSKGPGVILVPAALLSMASGYILAFTSNEWLFLFSSVLYGFGIGSMFPALQTWCINKAEIENRENAMASFLNFFDIGIGGGALLLGVLVTFTSYSFMFFVAGSVFLLFLLVYALSKAPLFNKKENKVFSLED